VGGERGTFRFKRRLLFISHAACVMRLTRKCPGYSMGGSRAS
jgi:hypothetical protein